MDLLNAIKREDAARTAAKPDKPVIFVCAQPDELLDDEIFTFTLVDNLKQLVDASYAGHEPGKVKCLTFSAENFALAALAAEKEDLFPCDFVRLEGVPGSTTVDVFNEAVFNLPSASYDRVVGDVVEVKRQASMMTEQELASSAYRRERKQQVTKRGDVRPLIDFDHGNPGAAIVSTGDDDDGAETPE